MDEKYSELKQAIRDIPDFPKKGIIFKDITTLIGRGDLFRKTIDGMVNRYKGKGIKKVVGVESRGFIFGAAVAYGLEAGLVPIRKKGKLPSKTISGTYDLEYGTDTIEMHEDAIQKGEKVLIIDDLLATGGTMKAAADLVKSSGAEIVGIAFILELSFLKGREKLAGYDVFSMISF